MKTKAYGYLVAPADYLNLSAPRISALCNPHSKAVNFAQRFGPTGFIPNAMEAILSNCIRGRIRDNTLGLRIESNK
jgi:hypothetical protein